MENIRPAARGVPQIEVTFDIDANGILNASARDTDTGTEQRITVSGSSNLDQSEVERMVADAESHRAEDRQLREITDARNELDAVAYQVERGLTDLGEAAPVHEKSRIEMLLGDARKAVAEQAPLDQVRSLTSELQQAYHSLGAAAAAAGSGPQQDADRQRGAGRPDGADDVIDAEFTTDE